MRSLRDLQEDRNAQPGEVTCCTMSSDFPSRYLYTLDWMVYPAPVNACGGGMGVTRQTIPPLQLLTFRIADVLAEDQQAARTYKLLVKRIEQLLQIVELQVR